MCKPASGVFVKGHIAYWSENSDRHEEIIKEHELNADGIRGTNIVRFEITPPEGDMLKPLNDWKYALDEGMESCLPDWYDAKAAEKSARNMLKAWAKKKLITGTVEELREGQYYLVGNANVKKLSGSSNIGFMYGSSKVGSMYDSSKVGSAKDNAVITIMRADDKSYIKSANVVVIDRSVSPPKRYVGVQK